MKITACVIIAAASAASVFGANDTFLLRKDLVVAQQLGPGWWLNDRPAVADYNGDGTPDLALCAMGAQTLLLNAGAAGFGTPYRAADLSNADDEILECGNIAADFNADGTVDLLGFSGVLLLNKGDGSFLPARRISPPEAPYARLVGVADFNRDRLPDLVYYIFADPAAGTVNEICVTLGRGDGTFQPVWRVTNRISGLLTPVVVADFNGDGVLDFGGASANLIFTYLGRGDGTFTEPIQTAAQQPVQALVPGDFNRDGVIDIASARAVHVGRGDGSFGAAFVHPVPEIASPFGWPLMLTVAAAGDFNQDGKRDVAGIGVEGLPGSAGNQLWIFPGKGDGRLMPPLTLSVGLTTGLAAADVDQDLYTDLVVVNSLSNTVSLRFSRPSGSPESRRAVSAASGRALVAPGSLATVFAPGLTSTPAESAPPGLLELGGTRLEVEDSAGTVRSATISFVSSSQVNFRVPPDLATGGAILTAVNAEGKRMLIATMQIEVAAPGIFTVPGLPFPTPRPAAVAVRFESNGTETILPLLNCPPGGTCVPTFPAVDDRPLYVILYGTGSDNSAPGASSCFANGAPLSIGHFGQPRPGVQEIKVLVPKGRRGLGTVVCKSGNVVSNPVWL